MDITNILNEKGAVAAVAAEAQQLQQQLEQASAMSSQAPSERGSEHEVHQDGDQPASYPPPPTSHPLQQLPEMPNYQQSHGLPGVGPNYVRSSPAYLQAAPVGGHARTNGAPAPKSFHCQTCHKAFARRSDLSRHERIHTGVRPHRCDWPGCGKQFIQRSALTVHIRVHTGEKPHMCDRCSKKFSDSSSLARHRRIHSGKRPYKCPYANCQKTFTRRTTLTRHQNHHTGTIEEAAAETEAHLRQSKERLVRPSEGIYSETGSTHSTPSPAQRNSLSPGNELPPMHLHGYIGNSSIPPHLRTDFQQASPRASPSAPSPTLSTYSAVQHPRPSATSHPSAYGPPQPLEPPAHSDHRPSSVAGSPHLTSASWASPTLNSVPSPGSATASAPEYTYPEPSGQQYAGGMPPHMYFPSSTIRRPQSTEPENYGLKSKSSDSWSTPA
ncbi:hypothetical protein VTO42DRAFT_5032 [Malbranchea cinnamomea]